MCRYKLRRNLSCTTSAVMLITSNYTNLLVRTLGVIIKRNVSRFNRKENCGAPQVPECWNVARRHGGL